MKKSASFLLLLALLACFLPARADGPSGTLSVLFYDEASQTYGSAVKTDLVQLTLDGSPLKADGVPALIQYINGQGRTLVPVRLVAEALGAEVLWVPDNRQVILLRGADTIVLKLGSTKATLNGQTMDLPDGVPAGAVKYGALESTMVPLRFVSEALGAQVGWEGSTFTASILSSPATLLPTPDVTIQPTPSVSPLPSLSPTAPPSAVPTASPSAVPTASPTPPVSPTPAPTARPDRGRVLRIESDPDAQSIFIATDHVPEMQVIDLGDRVAVDILGTQAAFTYVGAISVDNELVTGARFAPHDNDLGNGYAHTFRLVIDLRPGLTYQKNVRVEQQVGGVLITTFLTDADRNPVDFVPETPLEPTKSTIVLDAGHGGSASGATYEGILEKDITLQMTLKLQAILEQKGCNVVMTREDDRYMDLYDRADIANAINADLFVSIHANATTNNADFQGIFTYYHPGSERGKTLARMVQTTLSKATGGIDRGILNADFVVLRETNMCAILVETGFMTNHEELMRLCDEAYQQKIAEGIAEGVIQYLSSLPAKQSEPDSAASPVSENLPLS